MTRRFRHARSPSDAIAERVLLRPYGVACVAGYVLAALLLPSLLAACRLDPPLEDRTRSAPQSSSDRPGDESDGDAGEGKADDAKVGFPESCAMQELVAYLHRSDSSRHCGDLALGASAADHAVAMACVRGAIADRQPFQVFWQVRGTDGLPHVGILATWRGDRLETMHVVVDENAAFSVDITGAVASWGPCKLEVPERCDGPIETCLSCEDEDRVCGCLPAGRRPGPGLSPSDGATLEVRCQERGAT